MQWATGVGALGFMAYAAHDLAQRWGAARIEVSIPVLVGAFLPLVVGGLLLALAWALLVRALAGRPVRLGSSLALHAHSQLARYIPGKIGIPLVRAAGAPELGLPTMLVISSVAIEILSFVCVGCGSGLALLLVTRSRGLGTTLFGRAGWLALVALLALTLALAVIERHHWPRWLLVRIRAEEAEGPLVPASVLLVHLCYWITWAAHGYAVSAAVGAPGEVGLRVSGLFVLAPVLGAMALVVPAGLGVREAILSLGLAPSVGTSGAVAAAVISRLLTLVADCTVWLVTRPWYGLARSRPEPPDSS